MVEVLCHWYHLKFAKSKRLSKTLWKDQSHSILRYERTPLREEGKNLSFKACELQHGGAEVHLASLGSVLDLNIGKFCNFDLEELFWWTPASPTCEGASWGGEQHPPLGNEAINKHSIYALTTNERTNIYKGTLPQKAVEILKNMFLSFGQFIIWYTETMLFFPSYFEDKIRKKIMSITI